VSSGITDMIENGTTRRIIRYVVFVISILWLIPPECMIVPELNIDDSWHVGITWAVEKNLIFGRDIIFTNGPLCIFHLRLPINTSFYPFLIFDILFIAHYMYMIHYFLKNNASIQSAIVILCTLYLVGASSGDITRLYVIFLFSIFVAITERKNIFLLCSVYIAVFCFFIKVNMGIIIFMVLYSTFFYCLFTRRISGKVFTGLLLLPSVLLYIFCIALNVDFPGYISGSIHLIDAYNDAMALEPEKPSYIYLAISMWMLIFLMPFTRFRSVSAILRQYFQTGKIDVRYLDYIFIYSVVIFSLFILFKQAFVRAPGHTFAFFIGCVVYSCLLLFIRPFQKTIQYLLPVFIITAFVHCIDLSSINSIKTRNRAIITYWENCDYNIEAWKKNITDTSAFIPESALKKIGSQSVDIIPIDIAYLFLYDLNYNPRPVFQSYSAYDAFLDNLNYEKYMSDNAPAWIIFSNNGIDDRYPWFDESRTKLAIMQYYQPMETWKDFILLKRKNVPDILKKGKEEKIQGKMNEFIALPSDTMLEYARIKLSYSIWGKIKRTLYQPAPLYISFEGDGFPEKTFRCVKPVLEGGVLINKMVDGFHEADTFFRFSGRNNSRIRRIKIFSSNPEEFKDEITLEIESLNFDQAVLSDH
jgi:hypothetical protein